MDVTSTASLRSLPFRVHAPKFQECQTCLDRALAFTAKAATCPRLLQRAHTLSAHMCTQGHMHTHSHIHIVHIFLRVTVDLTHIIVTQSVPTTGLSLASFPPKLLESSNPQGLPPQTHSECAHPGPALDARSLYPNLRRSPSATCKPIELAPWEG